MLRKVLLFIGIFIAALVGLSNQEVKAQTPNPAAVYCKNLGYEWSKEMTPAGEVGKCLLPSGEKVDEWGFVAGKVGAKYNYCGKKGYEMEFLTQSLKCQTALSPDCVLCVLKNGNKIESTHLMDLESQPEKCGDTFCSNNENFENCPLDCSDIEGVDGGSNRSKNNYLFLISIVGLLILGIIILVIYFYFRKKNINQTKLQ